MDQPGGSIARIAHTLQDRLGEAGWCEVGQKFELVVGGRTNLVWRFVGPDSALMCKLALPGRDTPLFPNRPRDEAAALRALSGTGIAPPLRATLETPWGPCLIYDACPGRPWVRDPGPVGALLSRVHRCAPPEGLRRLSGAFARILAQGDAMLAGLAKPGHLAAMRPALRAVPEVKALFLHGDPVPGNIIVERGRPMLIDWQCPALGDPVHDLALFLSPAMQVLGRGAPLDASERAAFLQGYGDPDTAHRLALVESALSWRMVVYCAWRVERGHRDYALALAAESDHLHQLR
jgi:hypothetical protein